MYLSDSLPSRKNNFALIRHIAALLVIYGHCYPLADSTAKNSHTPDPFSRLVFEYLGFSVGIAGQMVSVFFFLSGLLIAKSAASQPWRAFWKARLLRIYPALWGNIVFCVVLGMICTSLAWDAFLLHPATTQFLWMNGTLWQAVGALPYVFEHNPWQVVNGSLWTLPLELRMYAICFVLALLGVFRRPVVFNLLLGSFIVLCIMSDAMGMSLDKQVMRLPLYFIFGMASYMNAAHIRMHVGIVIGLCAVAAGGYMLLPRACYDVMFAVALSYATLYAAYRYYMPRLDIGRIGDMSYGIYLYGFPVQQLWVWGYGGVISPALLCVLSIVTVIPLAIASWMVIEKPALALRYR